MLAPASNAAWVLSICSVTVIGTAGLFSSRGTDPVIATQMIQGLAERSDIKEHRFVVTLKVDFKPISNRLIRHWDRQEGCAARRVNSLHDRIRRVGCVFVDKIESRVQTDVDTACNDPQVQMRSATHGHTSFDGPKGTHPGVKITRNPLPLPWTTRIMLPNLDQDVFDWSAFTVPDAKSVPEPSSAHQINRR
jgi:hypothetical protein